VARSCRELVQAYLYTLQVWHVRNVEPCFAEQFPLFRHLKLVNLDLVRDATYLHRGLVPIFSRLRSLSLSDTRLANHNDDLASCILALPWPKLQHLDVPADADFLERTRAIMQPESFPVLVSLDSGGWHKRRNVILPNELLDRKCFPALQRVEQRHRGQCMPVEFRCRDLEGTGRVMRLLQRLRGMEALRLVVTGSSVERRSGRELDSSGGWKRVPVSAAADCRNFAPIVAADFSRFGGRASPCPPPGGVDCGMRHLSHLSSPARTEHGPGEPRIPSFSDHQSRRPSEQLTCHPGWWERRRLPKPTIRRRKWW